MLTHLHPVSSFVFALCLALASATSVLGAAIQPAEPERYTVQAAGKNHKFVFLLRSGDRLAVGKRDLEAWGMEENAGPRAHVEGVAESLELYWLDELQGLDLTVDHETKIARLSPQAETLSNNLNAVARPTLATRLERGWGTDLTYRAAAYNQPGGSPLLQARGNLGMSLGGLGRIQATIDADNGSNATDPDARASTDWQTSWRDVRFERDFSSGYILSAGQLGGNRGGVTSGLRFLGASLGTNVIGRARVTLSNSFGSFEDLVTLQEPASLEVRVNGRLIATRDVGAGRLSVADVPLDPGANDVEILVRYADGRFETFERQLIAGSELIAAGLSEVQAAIGVLDQSATFGRSSYDAPFGTFSYSRGLSENQTVHVSAEAREDEEQHRAVRAEWVGRLPGNLIARAAAAWSDAESPEGTEVLSPGSGTSLTTSAMESSGTQIQMGLEHARRNSAILIGATFSDEGYLTLRQRGYALEPRRRGQVNWQWNIPGAGNLSAFYRLQESLTLGTEQSLSMTYRMPIGPVNFNLRAGYTDRDSDGGLNVSAGFTMAVGRGSRLTVNTRSQGDSQQSSARYGKSLAANSTGLAWSAQLNQASRDGSATETSGGVSALMRNRRIEVRGEARQVADDWAFSGELGGSLVFVGNRLYATRPVGSSFVLVDTVQGNNVEIFENRRSAGHTSSGGRAFLPFVQSYSQLSVGLNPSSLAADMLVERTEQSLAFAPGFSRVMIPVRRSLQARAVLVDGEGNAWPPGSELRTLTGERSGEVRGIVGLDGVAYLVDLTVGEPLLLIAGERNCQLDLDLAPEAQGVVDLGELTCEE